MAYVGTFILTFIASLILIGGNLYGMTGRKNYTFHLVAATLITSASYLNTELEWGLSIKAIAWVLVISWFLFRFLFGSWIAGRFGNWTAFIMLVPATIYTIATLDNPGVLVRDGLVGLIIFGFPAYARTAANWKEQGLTDNDDAIPASATSGNSTCSRCGHDPCQCANRAYDDEQHQQRLDEMYARQEQESREWDERRQAEEEARRQEDEERRRQNREDGEGNIFHI